MMNKYDYRGSPGHPLERCSADNGGESVYSTPLKSLGAYRSDLRRDNQGPYGTRNRIYQDSIRL